LMRGAYPCRDVLYPLGAPWLFMCLDAAVFYSLFNSPYTPHREGHAVDVYFPGDEALLPFEEARVLEVRGVETPMHRSDALSHDYLIILGLDSMHTVKILHVEPRVRLGEKLVYGDPLGKLIVSGYFSPWSEPHMHLEVRLIHDRYRARGGVKLAIARHRYVPVQNGRSLEGVVSEVSSHYILLKNLRAMGEGPTPIAFNTRNGPVYLEGGYPHYGYAALYGAHGTPRGRWMGMYEVSMVESSKTTIQEWVERHWFRGIGTYIGREEVKLVLDNDAPVSGLKEGDIVVIDNLGALMDASGYEQ